MAKQTENKSNPKLSDGMKAKITALFKGVPKLKAVYVKSDGTEYYGQEKTAKRYFGEDNYIKISRDGLNL